MSPTKLVTAAHCVVPADFNYGTMGYNLATVISVTVKGRVVYDINQTPDKRPRVVPNPNYTGLYFEDRRFSETRQQSENNLKFNRLEDQALFDIAVIDFTPTGISVPVNDGAGKDKIVLPSGYADLTYILEKLSLKPLKHLIVIGAGLRETCRDARDPFNDITKDCSTGVMEYGQMPKPVPLWKVGKNYILPKHAANQIDVDRFVYNIGESQGLRQAICQGDSGGPLLKRGNQTSSARYELLGVAHGALGLNPGDPTCFEPVAGGTRFMRWTRTDSPAVARWLNYELTCTDCRPQRHDLAESRFAATYREFITSDNGNSMFLYKNQAIASASGKVRVYIDNQNILVAQCDTTKQIVWSMPLKTRTLTPKMLAMGYNEQMGLVAQMTYEPLDWRRMPPGYESQVERFTRFIKKPSKPSAGDFIFGTATATQLKANEKDLFDYGRVTLYVNDSEVSFKASIKRLGTTLREVTLFKSPPFTCK
jgi:hypothetical protein